MANLTFLIKLVGLCLCLVTLGKEATTGSHVRVEIGYGSRKNKSVNSFTEQKSDTKSLRTKPEILCNFKKKFVLNSEIKEIVDALSPILINSTLRDSLTNISYLTENNCSSCVHCSFCFPKKGNNCIKMAVNVSRIPHPNSKRIVIRSSARRFEFSRERPFLRIVSRKNESNMLYFPMGVQERNGSRVKRMLGSCVTPMALEVQNAEILCYDDEDFNGTKCMQRCAWGHTLPGGIRQFLKCYNDSLNEWEPHPIRACEAFVDCGIDLIHPGTVGCTPMTVDEGPTCKVSCERYENRTAVPQDVFKCDINGQWNKELPFCAVRSSGKILAKPPEKKLHDDWEKDFSLFTKFVWNERTPEFKLMNRNPDDFARWASQKEIFIYLST